MNIPVRMTTMKFMKAAKAVREARALLAKLGDVAGTR